MPKKMRPLIPKFLWSPLMRLMIRCFIRLIRTRLETHSNGKIRNISIMLMFKEPTVSLKNTMMEMTYTDPTA